MPTGFLPIDPKPPTCQRRDDMGRKVGMTWLLVFADANYRNAMYGNAYSSLGWAGRQGRRAGKRPQGMAKRLTFTEGRLSFDFAKVTTRPESQAFRQPRGGPMEAALNFSLTFLSREKEDSTKSKGRIDAAAIDAYWLSAHRSQAPHMPT